MACVCQKNVELNRNQKALTRVSPSRVQGVYPEFIAPDSPVCHPHHHHHPRPIHFSCWEDEAFHQRKVQPQKEAGMLFFFSQTTSLFLCPCKPYIHFTSIYLVASVCWASQTEEWLLLPQPYLHGIILEVEFQGNIDSTGCYPVIAQDSIAPRKPCLCLCGGIGESLAGPLRLGRLIPGTGKEGHSRKRA